jgi:restriction system protein
VSIPDYQSLMLPVLVMASKGETSAPQAEQKIADDFGLTLEERSQILPSGRQRVLHNRVHWAKFFMTKAGLLVSPRRGRFVATEAGRALLATNPDRIDVQRLLAYPPFREFYSTSQGSEEQSIDNAPNSSPTTPAIVHAPEATPEERIEAAYASMQSVLKADLLQRILANSPSFFETLIIELLVAMGYGGSRRSAATQLGRSGDGGVDGVINEDRLGLDRVYVQAKRYNAGTTVGRPEVQSFVGSLVGLGATKGVLVTTSSFSTQATDYVRHLRERVILIDGQRLAELMTEHNVGVRVSRAIEFKRLDEDFFSEDE